MTPLYGQEISENTSINSEGGKPMRTLKNTHKWLDSINKERKQLLKNLARIEKKLNDLQHKEDRLMRDLEAHVKLQSADPPASGIR